MSVIACGLLFARAYAAGPAADGFTALSAVSKTAGADTTVAAKNPGPAVKGGSSGFRVKKLLIDSDTMSFDRDTSEAVFREASPRRPPML